MRPFRASSILLAVVVIAGCSSVPLRTADRPASACEQALVRGILTNHRPNGLALREPDGSGVLVLWPFGYRSRGFVGSMELVDPSGRGIAREGDWVEITGGTNAEGVFVACAGTIHVVPPPS